MSILDRLAFRAARTRPRRADPLERLAAAGAAVALAAAANHLVARWSERRHPPTGRFLTVDGVRLHVVERGEGPAVVLLHGNGAIAEEFAISGLLDRLAEKHRVIAIDRPGFGYSARPRRTVWTAANQARLMRKALRQLGVERPVILGHSWGTLVALNMALDDPDKTAALVLLSGYFVPTPRLDVPVFSVTGIPILGDVMRYTISPLVAWLISGPLIRRIFSPAPVTMRFAAGFPLALSLRPGQLRASGEDTALMIFDAARTVHRHAELSVPVHIVAGEGDRIVDTGSQSTRLHRDVPDSTLRVVKGVGHMVHHQGQDAVVQAVESAVATSSATA
ncbi:alpha/beta fold hydrolase [Muricoccus radiodurans]|uniref:alpha/beta fold hydrolase n=1 Tax=Muricoccus radiodurans TaxID=2231721 RepID=UPI003CFA4BCC